MSAKIAEPTTREMVRLHPNQYAALEKVCPYPSLGSGQADGVHAAYLLGIQLVLSKLRNGFVA